jgi:hypothetical protein
MPGSCDEFKRQHGGEGGADEPFALVHHWHRSRPSPGPPPGPGAMFTTGGGDAPRTLQHRIVRLRAPRRGRALSIVRQRIGKAAPDDGMRPEGSLTCVRPVRVPRL